MSRSTIARELDKFEQLRQSLKSMAPVDRRESAAEKKKRVEALLEDWQEFMKYYWPRWCSAPFARFHRRYAKKVINNPTIYLTRAWSRDHGKSTFTQMLLVFLALKGEIKNVLYCSKSKDAAVELLAPIKISFEENPRLVHDFGSMINFGNWTDEKFILKNGCSFRALGRGQSPRGTKNQEQRPDCIVCDDIDDDELVESQERMEKAWQWMSGALYGSFSIGGRKRFIVLNNIIGEDCLLVRASEKADDHDQIDIYDSNGEPSWKERFTQEECEYMIDKMGILAQREYFNNPVKPGTVFRKEWIWYKRLPNLSSYKTLVAYLDPSFKSGKNADHKSLILLGLYQGQIHIIKAYCNRATIEEMIEWHYDLDRWAKARGGSVKFFMEEVFLQDLLYKDFTQAAPKYGYPIPLNGDTRKKPNKDVRISALSGYFERASWFFNVQEKSNHHMKRLVEQFVGFKMGNTKMKKDGPDACEGGLEKAKAEVGGVAGMDIIKRKAKHNKYKM